MTTHQNSGKKHEGQGGLKSRTAGSRLRGVMVSPLLLGIRGMSRVHYLGDSMKVLRFLVPAAVLALAGCSHAPIVLNYAPSSTMTVKGSETVGSFDYLPSASGKVKPNQIRNTAIGNFYLDKNVGDYFKQAFFTESRFVGISVSGGAGVHGKINEFLIDDLGYSVDWTLNVSYVVDNPEGSDSCYAKEKSTKRHTAKFANAFGTLNEVMKENIEEVFKDPAFVKCIESVQG